MAVYYPKGGMTVDRQSGFFPRLRQWIAELSSMQITLYAANACYFLALSVFPLLLLVLASLRYTPVSANDLIEVLEAILPSALMGAAERLIVSTYYNSSGALVSLSAVAALWSASRGIHGLLTGLNQIYGVREDRGIVYTRLISVVYLFVFLIVLVLTLVLHVFGRQILNWVAGLDNPVYRLIDGLIDVRFVLLLLVQTLAFCAIYMVLPNRRNRFLSSLPGAAVAAVGWQVFSNLFSVYVERMVAGYANIYGSVYTVALGMLWLYFCMVILLFGGALNKLLTKL